MKNKVTILKEYGSKYEKKSCEFEIINLQN